MFPKLDAGHSSTLARPDAPLTTGVTKIGSVETATKIGCYGNDPREIKKLISD